MLVRTQDVNRSRTEYPPLEVDRQPPKNLEAEQALLGAILIRNDALDRVIDFLEPQHFYDPLHAGIYKACCDLIAAGKPATGITVGPLFANSEGPHDLTGMQYLGRLATSATTVANAREYGRTIHDMATRRQLIMIAETMREAAYEAHIDFPPAEQIEEAETRLFSLVERGDRGGEVTFKTATEGAQRAIHAAHTGKKTGLDTGLVDLDDKLGGMQPTDLIVLAGRPSMGKSALATNIARHVAKNKVPVGFFSLEMSAEQIALRVLGDMADVSPDRARRGKLGTNERDTIKLAAADVSDLPIVVDQTGGLSIAQLSARARRMKRKHKIGLLVVDYLQLMHAGRKTENRVQDVSAITVGLKALAKELAIPVLALSQLSRAVESRDNKRPQLSDLRESGSIEQDADVVMFVFRDEYYVRRDKPPATEIAKYADWNAKLMLVAGKAEIVIGKQRQGPTGIVEVGFSEELMRFSNLAGSAVAVRHE